jgi:non-histone chromosomal protein 6
MFFSQDWRERIKAENPEASFGLSLSLLLMSPTWAEGFGLGAGEVGKLLGAKWKELEEEEKKVGLIVFNRYFLFLHD